MLLIESQRYKHTKHVSLLDKGLSLEMFEFLAINHDSHQSLNFLRHLIPSMHSILYLYKKHSLQKHYATIHTHSKTARELSAIF